MRKANLINTQSNFMLSLFFYPLLHSYVKVVKGRWIKRMKLLINLRNLFSFVNWIFLDLLVSVNIDVIKIITWILADVWQIIFSSDPPNILLCEGIGIGYKSIVKLKFCAQPMHQIYVIKYCILLKTSLSE